MIYLYSWYLRHAATSSKIHNNSWNGFYIFPKGVIYVFLSIVHGAFNASVELFGSFTLHATIFSCTSAGIIFNIQAGRGVNIIIYIVPKHCANVFLR